MSAVRAVLIRGPGGPEVLELVELPLDDPGAGEVQVEVVAAGVNYIDLHHRAGRYRAPYPMVPGVELAGRVVAIGAGVTGLDVGDRVAAILPDLTRPVALTVPVLPRRGAYAERINLDHTTLVPVPDRVDLVDAGAVLLQGLTADLLVDGAFDLRPGHVALVHAAAGGVGLLLVQRCRELGARVIGVVSSEDKAEAAREVGADEVLVAPGAELAEQVRAATDGVGVDVVYDSVGRDTFEVSLASTRTRGVVVLYGQASGPVEAFAPASLNPLGSLTVTAPSLAHYIEDPDEYRRRADAVLGRVADGRLRVRIEQSFDLDHAADAHRLLETRRTRGKVVIVPGTTGDPRRGSA